jgi:hypothetical protein
MPGLKLNMGNWNSKLLKLGNGIFNAVETADGKSLSHPFFFPLIYFNNTQAAVQKQ